MHPKKHDYEFPIAGSAWISSVELGAGVYLLEGRTHLVGHTSPAERQLVERGAMLIATVRFDGELHERSHPGRPVRALHVREALHLLVPAA